MSAKPLYESSLQSLPLLGRGKVRDIYALGDKRMLIVTTDRLSAFDVIMNEPIPDKGRVLTAMANFWFARLAHIVPNHLTAVDPESVVSGANEKAQVRGRAIVVKKLTPLQVEAVVRGYLAGSGWQEYQQHRAVCGVPLPEGLQNASLLPEPIFTPAAKAPAGSHDENISFSQTVAMVGEDLAERIRRVSLALYETAYDIAAAKGILIADTKFEFGLSPEGTLVLMDEVLTPDSSRYWPADAYHEGVNPPSFDKQYLRDWLETATVDGAPWNKQAPAPTLPAEVISLTASKYQEAWTRLQS